jgi:hypothetical protein
VGGAEWFSRLLDLPTGDTMADTIYNQERTSEKAFREFLSKAKATNGSLPPWWSDEKAEECVQFGLTDNHFTQLMSQGRTARVEASFGSITNSATEKSDIQEA